MAGEQIKRSSNVLVVQGHACFYTRTGPRTLVRAFSVHTANETRRTFSTHALLLISGPTIHCWASSSVHFSPSVQRKPNSDFSGAELMAQLFTCLKPRRSSAASTLNTTKRERGLVEGEASSEINTAHQKGQINYLGKLFEQQTLQYTSAGGTDKLTESLDYFRKWDSQMCKIVLVVALNLLLYLPVVRQTDPCC